MLAHGRVALARHEVGVVVMSTLREILSIAYPLMILIGALVILFYVGLSRGWWW